jgi:glutathionyl-hydroquinone reductase
MMVAHEHQRLLQVYVVYFKTNRNFIHEFPNMSNYVKDLYSNPGALLFAVLDV